MMTTLYAYYFCNLGGVCSLIRDRVLAGWHKGKAVTAVFDVSHGGESQLTEVGVGVRIAAPASIQAGTIAGQVGAEVLHLVDNAPEAPNLRRLFRGRLILEVHSSANKYLNQICDEYVSAVDHVFVPSRWSYKQVVSRLGNTALHSKVHIVPNIVRSTAAPRNLRDGGSAGRPRILWVGKLIRSKNWIDAVRIVRLVKRHVDCDFLMVTGGALNDEETNAFLIECAAAGVEVDWRHNLSRDAMEAVYDLVAEHGGALLSTTLAESFGLVIAEALAHGVPVVCPRTHALPELVEDDQNGSLFAVGDVGGAARALTEILTRRRVYDPRLVKDSLPENCDPLANAELYHGLCSDLGESNWTPATPPADLIVHVHKTRRYRHLNGGGRERWWSGLFR